jgi:ABC-type sugar transport system ATPase subunit
MRNIIKTFPGVKAVDRVSIKIKRGTVHAIVGENGAGKSTLMKILAGEYIADSGEILFNGEKVEIKSTKDAIDMGISTVYQELNLVPEMTIAENIFLGRELKGKNKLLVDANLINEETEKYLRSVGLPYNPKTK